MKALPVIPVTRMVKVMIKVSCIRIFVFVFFLFLGNTVFAREMPHKKISENCQQCHNDQSWQSIHFDHQKTGFILEGKHNLLTCKDCHDIRNFSKIESNCTSCHEDIHEQRLGIQCKNCHTADSWAVTDYYKAHANTTFILLGQHTSLDCSACHKRSNTNSYLRLSSDCYGCHKSNYLNTKNPPHVVISLGVRCEDCHSMNGWQPALYSDHETIFPIYLGTHRSEWNECTDCHVSTNNFQVFSCFNCHEHNENDMNRRHSGIQNYSYNSDACYSCHPTGSGD